MHVLIQVPWANPTFGKKKGGTIRAAERRWEQLRDCGAPCVRGLERYLNHDLRLLYNESSEMWRLLQEAGGINANPR